MNETPRTDAAGDFTAPDKMFMVSRELERELADYKAHFEACDKQRISATEALAQREEELAAERRKNRELSSAIGRAREQAFDLKAAVCRVVDALADITL